MIVCDNNMYFHWLVHQYIIIAVSKQQKNQEQQYLVSSSVWDGVNHNIWKVMLK